MANAEAEEVKFTHEQLMEVTTTTLNEMLEQDSFLCDLPKGVTLEEVNNQIALQYGRSVTVYVMRGDSEKLPVIVPQAEGTVAHLKKAIRRFMQLKLKRQQKKKQRRPKLISWRYVWKTYYLKFGDVILDDSNARLVDLDSAFHSKEVIVIPNMEHLRRENRHAVNENDQSSVGGSENNLSRRPFDQIVPYASATSTIPSQYSFLTSFYRTGNRFNQLNQSSTESVK